MFGSMDLARSIGVIFNLISRITIIELQIIF
jgi:hypothetical protein